MKEKDRPINHYWLTKHGWEQVDQYKKYKWEQYTVALNANNRWVVTNDRFPIAGNMQLMMELLDAIAKDMQHYSTLKTN